LKLALSNGREYLPSPEDGNRSSFQNIVYYNYLKFQTMDKVHGPSDSECYAPFSEFFRITKYAWMVG
jgi:hypothetical protein